MNSLLHREQVKELYSRALSNFSAHIFFIAIMYYFFQNGRSFSPEFLIITTVLSLFICYRYLFNRRIYSKIKDDLPGSLISRYHNYFTANVMVLGVLWALFLAGPIFLLNTSVIQTLLIFNGMVISCMSAMGISRKDNFTFLSFQFLSLAVILYYRPISDNKIIQLLLLFVFFLYLFNQQMAMYRTWSKFIFDRIDQQNLLNGYGGILSLFKDNKIVFKNNSFDRLVKNNKDLENDIIHRAQNIIEKNIYENVFEKKLFLGHADNTFSIHLQQRENKEVIVVGVNIQQQKEKEEQIKVQQAMLEQASKMASLGEMSGGLAHEINNPLAIISLNAEIARRNIDKSFFESKIKNELTQPIQKIEKMVERISKIIKSLRALSRDGTNDLSRVISCQNLIDDTLDLCETKFKNSGITVYKNIQPEATIYARETEVSQVLLNILNNAYDAIMSSKNNNEAKTIEIITKANHESTIIVVSDSGSGVAEEIRGKIMTPYFTTKEVGQGSGIGLSISSSLMKNNGGQLDFDWTQKNTTVLLTLPKSSKVSV